MSVLNHCRKAKKGLTLVEILIAMALMGFISLSISNFLVKSNVMAASMSMRFKEAAETHTLIADLQQDLRRGAYISPNSYNQRLEYTTYDATGAAVKKIYRISSQYLQVSTDGGTTWDSPFRISAYNKYRLVGSPKFLYSGMTNNCTDFTDTTGNSVYGAGDSAGSLTATCPASSGGALSNPSQATKVALSGFQFTTGNGSPEAVRTYPGDLLIALPSRPIRSASTPAAGVKDTILINSFVTNTANSLYGTAFTVKAVTFDPARERIFLAGDSSSNKIFIAERNGVLNGVAMNTNPTTIQLNSVALSVDGYSMLGLDTTGKKVYTFNTTTGASLSATATLDLVNSSSAPGVNLINNPVGIAYDSNTPDDVYIVGNDPTTSALKIYQRNKTTGALVGTAWNLPAAFSGTYPPSGLAIEPTSGDFLVVRNYVNGSSPNKTIDIYRITRAGVSTSFSVNIDDLGSTATGTTGNWGIGYDPRLNRLFLSDAASFKVYELTPALILSPRG